METITVDYKPVIVGGVDTGYYHEFLIYDKGDGSIPQYARGGPSPRTDGSSGDAPSGSSGSDGGGSSRDGVDPPFGYVKTETGDYLPGTPDYAPPGTFPSETIKSGDNISTDWNNITTGMTQYGQQQIGYWPTGPNSNSAVNAGLQADNLPPPTGQSDLYPSPPYYNPVVPTDPLPFPDSPYPASPWGLPQPFFPPTFGGDPPAAPHYEPLILNLTGRVLVQIVLQCESANSVRG
jgi:hypothetical protein